VRDGLLRLWAEREDYLAALDRLPPTLQHGDTGRKNLFAVVGDAGQDLTCVIDWGFVGLGVMGEDLAPVVASSVVWFNGVEPEDLPSLDAIAFEGYLAGLRDAGWRGDAAAVRLGYSATLALRFGMLIFEALALDEPGRERLERLMGHSPEEVADNLAKMRRFILARADEARELMGRGPAR
jgi:hypothetical protein